MENTKLAKTGRKRINIWTSPKNILIYKDDKLIYRFTSKKHSLTSAHRKVTLAMLAGITNGRKV